MRPIILFLAIFGTSQSYGYTTPQPSNTKTTTSPSRRDFFQKTLTFTTAAVGIGGTSLSTLTVAPQQAEAIGPVKLKLDVKDYSAKICPPDRPIPGEKAMKGMRGLCVTVKADVLEASPKVSDWIVVFCWIHWNELSVEFL